MHCIIGDAPDVGYGDGRRAVSQSVGGCPCAPEDADVLGLAERYGLSTFDAMIAASALHAGCDTLWSEDMQHGMTLGDGLRIVNPFRIAG